MGVALLATASPSLASVASDPKKIALVIGNSTYIEGDPVSGVEDAQAVEAALKRAGFTVLPPVLNLKLQDAKKTFDAFEAAIKEASVVVVFFSGHGFELNGKSYLMPVNGTVSENGAVPLTQVLDTTASAPDEAYRFIFVNACRSDSGPGQHRSPESVKAPSKYVMQFFAAGHDQVAQGGLHGNISPFSASLASAIAEPGLELGALHVRVSEEVSKVSATGQVPITSETAIPGDFVFRPPVYLGAAVEQADDGLVVLLDGKVVLDARAKGKGQIPLRLKARNNFLTVLAYNQRTYHNGQSWDRPEGWRYSLSLFAPDGVELTASGCDYRKPCLEDGEDVPFKDEPHHGQVFQVARADLFVDPVSAEVQLLAVDKDIWKREAPVWARNQGLLYHESILNFPWPVQTVFGIQLPDAIARLRPFLEFLNLDKIVKLPDLQQTGLGVRGNLEFRPWVEVCMTDPGRRSDRMRDFEESLRQTLAGTLRPFQQFDEKLSECVRDVASEQRDTRFARDEIKVYTTAEQP
jgi:hypothetical protein